MRLPDICNAKFMAAGLVGVLAGAVLWAPLVSAASRCPGDVKPASDAAVAYADRGDRCEGLYQQPVAASAKLQIIGAHRNRPIFDAGSGVPILVSAITAGAGDLKLRILSTKPQLYYRLDASLDSKGQFLWKRNIVDDVRVGLKPADIAALICAGSCEKSSPTIYPAALTEKATQSVDGITIRMRAALDLKELLVTVESGGAPLPNFNKKNVLDMGALPGGVAKNIFLDVGPGTYQLRALAIPVGTNASDEARAMIIIK
jgi:hypothetical protein